jgi:hypothetical protein
MSFVSEEGLACGDDEVPKHEVRDALGKRDSHLYSLFFDTATLRKQINPKLVSLYDVAVSSEETKFIFSFWKLEAGHPFAFPCIVLSAPSRAEPPMMCFCKEHGRWVLWKSSDPFCV